MPEALSVTGLRRLYGDTVAVDDISFDVARNEIVGLLGPNGAGKTTTINMILGVLQPSGGTIRIEGIDVAKNRSRALERTNFAAVYVTTAFLEDVWSHNFLNVFASPLSVPEYVSGLVASSVGTSAVGLAAMLVLANAFFGLSFSAVGLPLIPFLLVLFLSGIALGIFGAGLVLRLGPASEWLVWRLLARYSAESVG